MNKHNSRPIGIVLPCGFRAVHGTAASIKGHSILPRWSADGMLLCQPVK